MAATSIEWTDHSINPIRFGAGHYCQKLSPGCANCYASRLQSRFGNPEFGGTGSPLPVLAEAVRDDERGQLWLDESKLREVLKRRKPTRYFWCDMTDLFGSWVPDEWIDRCLAAMFLTPHHTHQVLTKRPERMAAFLGHQNRAGFVQVAACQLDGTAHGRDAIADWFMAHPMTWLLPNVWLGASVEDQKRADERIPHLLRTPAAVRFLSVEPLLGPVDLTRYGFCGGVNPRPVTRRVGGQWDSYLIDHDNGCEWHPADMSFRGMSGLHWVIVGGESGPGARPFDLEWGRSIVQQCKTANVPCFVKQVGSNPFMGVKGFGPVIRDRKGGDPSEWPEDLRVRQFPQPAGAAP